MSGDMRTCVDCGRRFLWSYESQRNFKEQKFAPPIRCRECRSHKKYERDSGMTPEVGEFHHIAPYESPPAITVPPPPRPVAEPPPIRRPAPTQQNPVHPLLRRPGNLAVAVVFWLVLAWVLSTWVGWPAAAVELALGAILYVRLTS